MVSNHHLNCPQGHRHLITRSFRINHHPATTFIPKNFIMIPNPNHELVFSTSALLNLHLKNSPNHTLRSHLTSHP